MFEQCPYCGEMVVAHEDDGAAVCSVCGACIREE